MKQLQDIVKTLQTTHVEGNTAVKVLDITADSRAVKVGSLFIALDGATVDGHNYVNKAVEAGAQNIVFGALTPGNEIDTDALETVSIAAQGLPITFHMAFDEVTDQEKAIDQLVEFGVDKILTHGGPLDQPLNTDKLKSLIDYAKGKINIIIGGGVNAENFENLAQLTGTNYVHGTKIIKL